MQLNYLSFTLITSEKSEAMLPPILSSHAPKTTTSRKTTKPSITRTLTCHKQPNYSITYLHMQYRTNSF
jgi:hypothetical protein